MACDLLGTAPMRARILASALIALGLLALWQASKATRWQAAGELVWHARTSERVVALTFDDGPFPGHVDEVLRMLSARRARTTFFLTGEGVAADREDAAKMSRRATRWEITRTRTSA